jgi:hypothetical protein
VNASANRRVLAVIPDLFFATKVAATARSVGAALELAAPERAADELRRSQPALVLIDLHAPGAVELVAALKSAAPSVPVVGFYSHVETALRRDALAAGADAALPRSQFVQKLAGLLANGIAELRQPPPGASAPGGLPGKAAPEGSPRKAPKTATSGALVEDEAALTAIARDMRSVAVVGIKDGRDPDAAAFNIPELLLDAGIRVIGVNPMVKEAFGQRTLGSVAELSEAPDVLDVFRRSEAIPELTEQLLALPADLRPAVVWLQSGIRHDESAARLAAAGYRVVQDRCLGVYRRRAERSR